MEFKKEIINEGLIFNPGDLISFDIEKQSLYLSFDNNFVELYEKIDLSNFPSWNDYSGKSYLIKKDAVGIILSKIDEDIRLNVFDNSFDHIIVYKAVFDTKIVSVLNLTLKKI